MLIEDPHKPRPRNENADQSLRVLSKRYGGRLRVIAKQSVTYWFNHAKLDTMLAQYVRTLEGCQLIYAIDQSGRQLSSNIYPGKIDPTGYGQDLSQRPYVVSLSVLSSLARQEAFAYHEYVSKATGEPCYTVMYGVTTESELLGFIAADFDPDWEGFTVTGSAGMHNQ